MPRLTPVKWKILECIFLKDGFHFERQVGSHRSYIKEGILRPVIIPTYNEIDVDIIRSNMRTAGVPETHISNTWQNVSSLDLLEKQEKHQCQAYTVDKNATLYSNSVENKILNFERNFPSSILKMGKKEVSPEKPDLKSMDIVSENRNKLKNLFYRETRPPS